MTRGNYFVDKNGVDIRIDDMIMSKGSNHVETVIGLLHKGADCFPVVQMTENTWQRCEAVEVVSRIDGDAPPLTVQTYKGQEIGKRLTDIEKRLDEMPQLEDYDVWAAWKKAWDASIKGMFRRIIMLEEREKSRHDPTWRSWQKFRSWLSGR